MLSADDSVIREFVLEHFSLNVSKTLFLISGYHTEVGLLCFEKDTHMSGYKEYSKAKEKVCESIFLNGSL